MKDVERTKAVELFGTAKEPSALASKVRPPLCYSKVSPSFGVGTCLTIVTSQIMGIKSRTFDVPSTSTSINGKENSKAYRVKLTEKEKKRVEELIRNAKTLQEISRLEKELNEGKVPGGIGRGDVMEE